MLRFTENSINKALQLTAPRMSIVRRFVVPLFNGYRNKSTFIEPKKTSSVQQPEEHRHKPKHRFVNIESALAKENKYLYTMPKDAYFSASKVKRILELGKPEDAVEFITALPLRLQATATWNEVIGHCARIGRVNYAESCYAKMRKRGFKPNEYTFTHMLTAYVNSNSPNAVQYAEEWFKKIQTFDIPPSTIHFTNLMRVYNQHSQPEKTIQLLKEMPEVDVAPDTYTYSVALQACSQLTDARQQAKEVSCIWDEVMKRVAQSKKPETRSLLAKKASKIASEMHTTRIKKLQLDDKLVIALITAAKGVAEKTDDMSLGVEIIDTLFRMAPSKVIPKSNKVENGDFASRENSTSIRYPFNVKIFDTVLRFAKDLREWRLFKEYFDRARKLYPDVTPDETIMDMVTASERRSAAKGRRI